MSTGINNLTEGRIFRQLVKLAMPIMATGFVQMAYTLMDMAWVGRLGSESVAAIGSVGILVWLTFSITLLTKTGAEVSIAQSIGAGRMSDAKLYASHTTTIALIISIIIGIFLFSCAELIISFFKLSSSITHQAVLYLQIISTALPFYFLAYTFSGIYNACGRSQIPFYLMASGLACNMILDPLLIFGTGSFGGLGTNGAAYATWLSQALVFLLFVWQMKQKNGILNRFPYWVKLKYNYTIRILKLGFPVAVMNVLFASINMYLARIASIYGGHIGLMSQTTGGQIEGITWNTSQGFSTALGAFVAQNFGAQKFERTQKAYRYTLGLMSILGIFVTVSFIFYGKEIFGILVPEEQARIAGGEYLFIVAFSQLFMMFELTTQGMFNGFGRTIPPAIVSICLNAVRIPLALYLASLFGVTGIWLAIAISMILKGIILPVWFRFIYKHIKKQAANITI